VSLLLWLFCMTAGNTGSELWLRVKMQFHYKWDKIDKLHIN